MKKILIFLFISLSLSVYSQTKTKALIDSVLLKTAQTSMYIPMINWDSLQNQVRLKSESAQSIEDLKPAFESLLNGLKDHHGKIMSAKNFSYLAWFTDIKNKRYFDNRKFDNEILKVINDVNLKHEFKILKGRIGYLKIVGIPPNVDIEKESSKIRESVDAIANKKVDKWIIDLRYNGGGNMHPMMAGIAQIIGDGVAGSVVNLNEEKLFNWEIKGSNFIYDGYQAVTLKENPKLKKNPKIAVLTSRWTVSSGEIVATSLKGRPKTKFFGEATGGYTTNNGWEVINDEVILVISTGIFCDRLGKMYEKNIPVDVEIPFETIKDTEKDNCVIEAKKWLKQI